MYELCEYQIDPEFVENKLFELEDRSRRWKLRNDWVKQANNEIWKKRKKHLETFFKENFCLKDNIIIERSTQNKVIIWGLKKQTKIYVPSIS